MSDTVIFHGGEFVSPSDIARSSLTSRAVTGGAVFEAPNSGGSISLVNGRAVREQTSTDNSYQVNGTTPSQVGTITQARTAWGSPITGADIKENSIIRIGGMETSVKAAIAAGLVTKNQDGSFAVVDRSQGQAGGQQDQQQQGQPQAEALTSEVEHSVSVFAERVNPTTVLGAIANLSKGQPIGEDHILRAADQLRTSPDNVREAAERIRTAFEGQAKTSINATGLNSEEVFTWAWANQPDLMKQAIHRHATERTTEGYRQIADSYLSQLDTLAPQYLYGAELGEGLSLKEGPKGKVILVTPQGEFEYRSALRMGLIKVSKARG